MQGLANSHNAKNIKRYAILGVVAFYLLFFLLILGLRADEHLRTILLGAFYVAPIILGLFACLWAAKRTTLYKRLWYLAAVSMSIWMAGAYAIASEAIRLGPANVPALSLANAYALAYIPSVLGIMYSLGRIPRPIDNKGKRFIADISMVSLAIILLCYEFILVPLWYGSIDKPMLVRLSEVSYPVVDWMVIVGLLFASRRLDNQKIEGWIIFALSAFAATIIADVPIYYYGYILNPVTVLLMDTAAVLIIMAAIDEITGVFLGIIDRSNKHSNRLSVGQTLAKSKWQSSVIPFITFAGIVLVWVHTHYSHLPRSVAVPTIIIAAAIFTLSLYRNHLLIIDNVKLFRTTLRDGLTGLGNHRYFQEALLRAVERADSANKPVSLVMADIDNFSQINSIHGHAFGDRVIATVGDILKSKCREYDEPCRLGGDEFAVILPHTDSLEAYVIAEQLQQHINKALFANKSFSITIGVSTYPTLVKNKDELVHTADGALYWGKFNGKDSVFLYHPEVVEVLSAEERAKRAEEASFLDMVRSLAEAVDARDQYTRLHSQGVSIMAGKLAEVLGLNKDMVSKIEAAGILHDIGKIGLPDNILSKPGKLTDEEIATVKAHPILSGQIIQSTNLKDIVPAVRAHHERWDGNGYPDRLKGDEIPLEARILAIADAFDAMTTDRPYRNSMPISEALNEIKRCAGMQFDPELVEVFLTLFPLEVGAVDSQSAIKQVTGEDEKTTPAEDIGLASSM